MRSDDQMKVGKNRRELVKVALLYHRERLTQSEIAKRIGISRSLVSKYLIDAEKTGVVEVYIKSESSYSVDLELRLEQALGLKRCVVIDTNGLKIDEVPQLIYQTSVRAFSRDILRAKSVGVSWGKTVRRFVDEFPYENVPDAKVVPLIGGMGSDHFDIHSNQLAYDLSRKLRASCKYLYAPAMVNDPTLKQSLLENDAIRDVIEAGRHVDLALLGVASPLFGNSTMEEIGYIDGTDVRRLRASGAIGDVNSRFFDEYGAICQRQIDERVIGITLDDIKSIDKKIAVVYQDEKREALRTAIRAGIINGIAVTDRIAHYLLSQA